MSLSLYNEIEKDRRAPSETFNYEGLAELLELDEGEKALLYDLAAKKKGVVPSDIEDVMMYSNSGSYARIALRLTNEGAASEEDWKKFVSALEERKRGKRQETRKDCRVK